MPRPSGVIRVKLDGSPVDTIVVPEGQAVRAFNVPIVAEGLFRKTVGVMRIEFDPPFVPVPADQNYAPVDHA